MTTKANAPGVGTEGAKTIQGRGNVHSNYSMSTTPLERVLTLIPSHKKHGDHYKASCPCPAHANGDKNPSLTIKEGSEGSVLLHCFAGCTVDDIVTSIGLKKADLFPSRSPYTLQEYATEKRLPVEFLKSLGVSDGDGDVLIPYTNADGTRFRTRARYIGWDEDAGKLDRKFRWKRDGDGQTLYGLHRLGAYTAGYVVIVEGESDCHTLWHHAIPAVGLPGATGWSERRDAARFRDFERIFVVIECYQDGTPDPGGTTVLQRFEESELRERMQFLYLRRSTGFKDPSAIHVADPDQFDSRWKKAMEEALTWADVALEPASTDEVDTSPVNENQDGERPPWNPQETSEYAETSTGLVWRKGTESIHIANFIARIAAEETLDDGVSTSKSFRIAAHRSGQTVEVDVPAEAFPSGNWIARLGSDYILSPGQSIRDRMRHAVQVLSRDKERLNVYTHTGWRKIAGKWAYLHADGAIGAEGVTVRPHGSLRGYRLPNPPNDPREGIAATLRLLELAPPVTFPLVAAIFRSVLGDVGMSLYLIGPTGSGKTTLAALAQQHFGAGLDMQNLPANWSSTANSLELTAFYAKDAALVIDELVPYGTYAERSALFGRVNRVLRASANSSARGRLRSDSTAMPERPPRGLIIVTGEDTPDGQSLQARTFFVEVPSGAMKPNSHRRPEQDGRNGLYAECMAGYLSWIAPDLDAHRCEHRRRVEEVTSEVSRNGDHRRIGGNVAQLQAAFERFTRYAVEMGNITAAERDAMNARCMETLLSHVAEQSAMQRNSDPVTKFLGLIGEALLSGRAHLKPMDESDASQKTPANGWKERATFTGGTSLEPSGDCIGYVGDDGVYLLPTAAHRIATATGDGTAVAERTMHKRLLAVGAIASRDEARGRMTTRITPPGAGRVSALHLKDWRKHEGGTYEIAAQSSQSAQYATDDAQSGPNVWAGGPVNWAGGPDALSRVAHTTGPILEESTLKEGDLGGIGPIGPEGTVISDNPSHVFLEPTSKPLESDGFEVVQ